MAAFRVAFARWIADATGDRSLGDHITEAASALRVLAGGRQTIQYSHEATPEEMPQV